VTDEADKRKRPIRRRTDQLREYADPLAVLIVAIGFAVLGALEVLGEQALAAVTLAVLAAVSGVMLRQRQMIDRAQEILADLPGALDTLNRTVSAVASGSDYEILESEGVWDITDAEGRFVIGTKKKHLRFVRDNVISLHELTRAQGGDGPYINNWRFEPPMLSKVGEFSSGGNQYILVSLGRMYRRNEELRYTSRRDIHNLFTDHQNSAALRADEGYETRSLRMEVIWPEDRVPDRVVVQEITAAGETVTREYAGQELPRNEDSRPCIAHGPIIDPPPGKRIVISWVW
jgi:hypothetical protein